MRKAEDVKVADEVWIAAALLQREHPDRDEFSLKEIEERLKRENLAGGVRAGVYPHISVHCVANVRPTRADIECSSPLVPPSSSLSRWRSFTSST